jgi:hypothetical protein
LDIDSFTRSLSQNEPPAHLSPALLGVWHGIRGEWDKAHELAQAVSTSEGAWVHAWLHRIEGDIGNAGYWYRRAGKPVATGDTDQEGRHIAASLLCGSGPEA